MKKWDPELLDLSNCHMSCDGGAAITEGLKCCIRLATLYLQENNIGDAGSEALARALSCCKRLKTLDLSYNAIGDAGACTLADILKHILYRRGTASWQ